MNKLQKKTLIFLIVLALVSPLGILLPKYFNSGEAWGEWSADTLKEQIGYTPEGIKKNSETWKAPLSEYTVNTEDKSILHQSFYYILSGIIGTGIALIITYIISKKLIRNDKQNP